MNADSKWSHPKWLEKREELFKERGYRCQSCKTTDKTLTVHHGYYRFNAAVWDYENSSLWVLCWPCHKRIQLKLIEVHRIIGHIHPDDYDSVKQRIDDSTFDLRFGVTKNDWSEMVAEQQEAESVLYSDYSASIISTTELGSTVAYDLEEAICQRFPGIETGVTTSAGERDGIVCVSGPDSEIISIIEAWSHKWGGQF